MRNPALLYPMFALEAWTLLVLMLIPIARVRSARRREIDVDDFKYGESPAVPAAVSIPNCNDMNLLELPMLFYVVCLVLYVSAGASSTTIALAWAFVCLRIVLSVIHLTYNRVVHRLAAFGAANVVLVLLRAKAGAHLPAATP